MAIIKTQHQHIRDSTGTHSVRSASRLSIHTSLDRFPSALKTTRSFTIDTMNTPILATWLLLAMAAEGDVMVIADIISSILSTETKLVKLC